LAYDLSPFGSTSSLKINRPIRKEFLEVKRYLIEPEYVAAPKDAMVYRIVDTQSGQVVPLEGDDIDAVARACAEFNEGNAGSTLAADQLPDDIVQAIAISNAKSIGEQPAILANMTLAQQIFDQNMQQQNSIAQQQALNLIRLAVVAKCVNMIGSIESNDPAVVEKMGRSIEKMFHDMNGGAHRQASDSSSAQAS
jgi:hypothetical protein